MAVESIVKMRMNNEHFKECSDFEKDSAGVCELLFEHLKHG